MHGAAWRFLSAVLLISVAASAQTEKTPTLNDTLKWLDGKLREPFLITEKNDEGNAVLTSQTRSMERSSPCEIKLTLLVEICPAGADACGSTNQKLKVPLGALSLSDIKVTRYESPDGYRQKAVSWWVVASTSGSTAIIPVTTMVKFPPNPPHESTGLTSGFSFFFTDEEIANRVKKALAHAAEVCGAKSDVF